MNISDVRALGDLNVLSLTIWGEARGEAIDGQAAVGCVVRNRLTQRPARFGASYSAVCLAPDQFSCWIQAGGAANAQAVMAMAQAIENAQTIKDAIYRQCRWLASGIIVGEVLDLTRGSTHYVTSALYNNPAAPAWVKDSPVLARIGSQVYMAA